MAREVKIYSKLNCPYCSMVKQFFKQNNIKYEEVDVSDNQEAAMEMVEKSGQTGVPVIEIDGKIIVGFNLPAIKKALKGSK